jgi:predicted metal-dependent phosphotriesterase family hydrolase
VVGGALRVRAAPGNIPRSEATWNFARIATGKLILHLKQTGVSESSIRTMTVENPRSRFSLV